MVFVQSVQFNVELKQWNWGSIFNASEALVNLLVLILHVSKSKWTLPARDAAELST